MRFARPALAALLLLPAPLIAQTALHKPIRLVIALASDKEVDEILSVIPPGLPVTRCAYHSPRARGRDGWPAAAQPWRWCDHIADALAVQPAGVDVCITGSLYLAGEALDHLGLAGSLPG